MNLDLDYDEAIDFIIHLDELNLKHDDPDAYKRAAREILNKIQGYAIISINNGVSSYVDNKRGCTPEDSMYHSDSIRTFLENKSLLQRLQEEKEAEIAALKNGAPATSGQNNNLPAVAKPARPFVLNLINTEYPDGEFKGLKHEAIATEVFARAKAEGYEEKDIPAVSTIMRHYL